MKDIMIINVIHQLIQVVVFIDYRSTQFRPDDTTTDFNDVAWPSCRAAGWPCRRVPPQEK